MPSLLSPPQDGARQSAVTPYPRASSSRPLRRPIQSSWTDGSEEGAASGRRYGWPCANDRKVFWDTHVALLEPPALVPGRKTSPDAAGGFPSGNANRMPVRGPFGDSFDAQAPGKHRPAAVLPGLRAGQPAPRGKSYRFRGLRDRLPAASVRASPEGVSAVRS